MLCQYAVHVCCGVPVCCCVCMLLCLYAVVCLYAVQVCCACMMCLYFFLDSAIWSHATCLFIEFLCSFVVWYVQFIYQHNVINMFKISRFNAVRYHNFPVWHQDTNMIAYLSFSWFLLGVDEFSGHSEHLQHFAQSVLQSCALCRTLRTLRKVRRAQSTPLVIDMEVTQRDSGVLRISPKELSGILARHLR